MSNVLRYSVVGAPSEAILAAGGANLSIKPLIGITFVSMTVQQAQELTARVPGVTITPVGNVNLAVRVPTPVPAIAGISLSPEVLLRDSDLDNFRTSFSTPLLGQGITVAILDTGVRTTHESLGGKVVYSENFSSSPGTNDVYNHGTGVAHIIHAMAPESNIINFKVISDNGEGAEENIANAVERCIQMNIQGHQYAPQIINLSLGSVDDGNPNNVMRVACRTAIDQYNIWIAAAAGNDGPAPGTITSPASEKYVMAVGSVTFPENSLDEFSSRGPTKEGLVKPDVLMVGSNVLVASSIDDTSAIAKSGTSFACPFMCGIATWFRQGSDIESLRNEYISRTSPRFSVDAVRHPTMQNILDEYVPRTSLRPGDTVTLDYVPKKDNSSGWGTFCGPMAVEFLSEQRTAAISGTISGIVQPFITIMVLGMMMKMTKSIMQGTNNKKAGAKYA